MGRTPDRILEVGVPKIWGLEDFLEVNKMSLDVLDSDIHYSTATLFKSHFAINIFPEVPEIFSEYLFFSELVRGISTNRMETAIQLYSLK